LEVLEYLSYINFLVFNNSPVHDVDVKVVDVAADLAAGCSAS